MTQFEPLESHTVVPYLLKRGLLAPVELANELTVEDISRRNRSFRVRTENHGFIVKQIMTLDDQLANRTLTQESRTLSMIQEAPAFRGVRRAVPSIVDHDTGNATLITELVAPATTLTKLVVNLGDINWNTAAFESAGRTLGAFHDQCSEHLQGDLQRIPIEYPNPMRLQESIRSSIRSGAKSAVPLEAALEFMPWDDVPGMVEAWGQATGACHGDVRWDNILITYGRPIYGNYPLHLIDWEFTGRGNPSWDVACFLAEFPRFRALTAAVHAPKTIEDVDRLAAATIEDSIPAARAFLHGYAEQTGSTVDDVLASAMPFMPWVLAVMSWEIASNAARTTVSDTLSPEAQTIVNWAREFLDNPKSAQETWFHA